MSSMRTFSPHDLLMAVQKIKVSLYETSSTTVIPEGDGFYINQADKILDTTLADLGVTFDDSHTGISKLEKLYRKLNGVDHGLFGTSAVQIENPTLQDVILKADSVYDRLYKREGSMCIIS